MDPRSRWREWRHGLPADVGMLALLLLVASACCLLAVLFPISDRSPVELARALMPIGFATAFALLVAGARTPAWALHAAVVFVTVAASVLISQSATSGGLMMTAWSLIWTCVYVAVFFPPRAIRLHVSLMTVGLGAGVLVAGLPGTVVEFSMMAITLWVAALALGSMSARLRAQADSDPLTGLPNRGAFQKAAAREIALAGRTGFPLTVALVDLDDFKTVNDIHGHAAGDRLLVELASAWERALRPGDVIARYGGDEFGLLFPATGEAEARVALARLRGAHRVGWSAGVAEWRRGEALEACMARADMRLYEAKAGRATVRARAALP